MMKAVCRFVLLIVLLFSVQRAELWFVLEVRAVQVFHYYYSLIIIHVWGGVTEA